MKKLTAFILSALMAVTALTGCGGQSSSSEASKDNSSSQSATGDWSYIADKGDLVIGITYFEPMNYKDENGELTGFETEFAQSVCEKLGVKANFQKIDWDSKEVELNAKTIDCIWNGLTITDERQENMGISTPYMENKQVMVTKAENADKFTTAEAVKGATVVAEKKSAGEDVAKGDEFFKEANYVSVDSQAKALLEVKSGTADIAIIDYVMSIGTISDGTDYADLKVVEGKDFAKEQYGIAVRKGDAETLQKINNAVQAVADDGKLEEIAKKYNLQDLLLVKAK
ncbi:transporter substrate-binding domain-containing protein [Ruminococcus sp.]|uniref:transporter substrate-binding domain-containing protein n=1 Tax=Ruminococcus sp. TaxID=41978 RepID=UPI0025DBF2C0|nr:transporter substrate-binding domain-containing protein [Ruminococcus sp.]MCI6615915.1 transporter substrate-binding domain-containing protein [Ruminococcus sp.]